MFEEPNEGAGERVVDPAARAREKSDEFRMHAEFAAVFEGTRKFAAQILPGLDADVAREVQKGMARLEKSRIADSPVVSDDGVEQAAGLLGMATARGLSTNDYHVYRRPGEVMLARWLEGEQVAKFYERLQAHFDVALNQFREEERQAQGWKQDPQTLAYLEALDAVDLKMADRYLRDVIRQHGVPVLSTQTADEIDILHLCDYVMGVEAADVVGAASAPPEDGPTERDRAWFFKLFALRGTSAGVEQMCFYTYLQKADDGGGW
jgi:hypothetical protein